MARVKLTTNRIRDFRCEPNRAQSFLWDSEVPGLAVRATTNGAKSYVFQGKLGGSTIRVTIGDVRSWFIESSDPQQPGAREEGRRLQGMIDRGIDPRHAKADQLAAVVARRAEEARQDALLEDVWQEYMTARKTKWSSRHYQDHAAVIDAGGGPVKRGKKNQKKEAGALASLRGTRLSDISKERVRQWLQEQVELRPTQAALAFRLLRAFLNWCQDMPNYANLAKVGACAGRVAQELPKQKPKTDCLQREQLTAWFAAIVALPNSTISSYLQVLLLTGPRREELAELQWDDVDFKWKTLTIHDKVDGERTIPLTPYVAALLRQLQQRQRAGAKHDAQADGQGKPSPWVFSSPKAKSGRLQDPSHAHRNACQAAGIEGMTLHGLRRSFKSLAEWVEMPVGIVAQIMGHKPSATAEKHYTIRPIDLLRLWHTRYESWLLAQAGIHTRESELAAIFD